MNNEYSWDGWEEVRRMMEPKKPAGRDYYADLGVSRDATDKEISAAYKKIARRNHSDTGKKTKDQEDRLRRVNEAHEVLKNKQRRKYYNAHGANAEMQNFASELKNRQQKEEVELKKKGEREAKSGEQRKKAQEAEEAEEEHRKKADPHIFAAEKLRQEASIQAAMSTASANDADHLAMFKQMAEARAEEEHAKQAEREKLIKDFRRLGYSQEQLQEMGMSTMPLDELRKLSSETTEEQYHIREAETREILDELRNIEPALTRGEVRPEPIIPKSKKYQEQIARMHNAIRPDNGRVSLTEKIRIIDELTKNYHAQVRASGSRIDTEEGYEEIVAGQHYKAKTKSAKFNKIIKDLERKRERYAAELAGDQKSSNTDKIDTPPEPNLKETKPVPTALMRRKNEFGPEIREQELLASLAELQYLIQGGQYQRHVNQIDGLLESWKQRAEKNFGSLEIPANPYAIKLARAYENTKERLARIVVRKEPQIEIEKGIEFSGDREKLQIIAQESLTDVKTQLTELFGLTDEQLKNALGTRVYLLLSGDTAGYIHALQENQPFDGNPRVLEVFFKEFSIEIRAALKRHYQRDEEKLKAIFGQAYHELGFDREREKFKLEVGVVSTEGYVWSTGELGEDAFTIDEANQTFGVFDGMGGHAAGKVAANLAKRTLESMVTTLNVDSITEAGFNLVSILQSADFEIQEGQKTEGQKGMATTGSVVKILGNKAIIASVGDSRIYKLNKENLKQISVDDNLVEFHVSLGTLTREKGDQIQQKLDEFEDKSEFNDEDALYLKTRNKITNSLGNAHNIESAVHDVEPGNILLIVSDGISDELTGKRMESVIVAALKAGKSAQEIAKDLDTAADEVNRSGKGRAKPYTDDRTTVVIKVL